MVVHETLLVKYIETKVFLKNKLGLGHGLVVYCSLSIKSFSILSPMVAHGTQMKNYLIIGYV